MRSYFRMAIKCYIFSNPIPQRMLPLTGSLFTFTYLLKLAFTPYDDTSANNPKKKTACLSAALYDADPFNIASCFPTFIYLFGNVSECSCGFLVFSLYIYTYYYFFFIF